MECFGGNGYVEEGPLARLYREAPLNGIWEGSANVICLDVLRALARSPQALETFAAEVQGASDPAANAFLAEARALFAETQAAEGSARRIVERLALAMSCALMRRHATPAAADAFAASRAGSLRAFGTLPVDGTTARALMERARLTA
jgi:putative acyl-CoA dehydrogenase